MLKKLFTKSLYYFTILAIGKFLAAGFFILLARFFLPEKLGVITYFTTINALITAIFDFGLRQFYQKKMATTPHQWLLAQLLVLRGWLFVASSLLLLGLSLTPILNTIYLLPLIIYNFADAIFCVGDSYFLSGGQTLRIGIKNLVRNILIFGFFIFAIFFPEHAFFNSTTFCILCLVISSALVAICYFPWRALRLSELDVSWQKMRALLKKSWTYGVMDGTSVLYSRADSLAIENLLGSGALGIYGSAYRFLDAFNLLPQALFHNLFSVAARENGVSRRQLKLMVLVMGAIGAVVGILLAILSQPILPWLLGEAYVDTIPVLQIFSLVVFLFFVNSPLHVLIQSSRFLKQYLPWMGAIVALNLILNIILLPLTGTITTAAWVLVLTQVGTVVTNLFFIKKLRLK